MLNTIRNVLRLRRRLQAALRVTPLGADGLQDCLLLDEPVDIGSRYGEGKPPHPLIAQIFETNRAEMIARLNRVNYFASFLSQIALSDDRSERPGQDPFWRNWFLPPLDGAVLYAMLADIRPARYLEVGSGNSTKFARRAVRDHNLATKVISIDPQPRAEIDALCDEIARVGAEKLALQFLLERLVPGDILFVDGSHYVLPNSDVVALFLDVLPRLPSGVIVHVHDIAWPFDYGGFHRSVYYSEQYLLAAYLLAGESRIRPLFSAAYVQADSKMNRLASDLLSRIGVSTIYQAPGSSFWFRWQ